LKISHQLSKRWKWLKQTLRLGHEQSSRAICEREWFYIILL
jgi:hypothetical protein